MPEAIEVTAAQRGANELMIHLLNNPTPLLPWRIANREKHDADMTTFLSLREVNPIHNIRVKFNDFTVKSARLPLQETNLEVSGNACDSYGASGKSPRGYFLWSMEIELEGLHAVHTKCILPRTR